MVRTKFKLNSITRRTFSQYENGQQVVKEVQTLELFPVCDGSPENKAFFASTPTGKIELGTVNAEAVAQFELNGEYYVMFEPAPKAG